MQRPPRPTNESIFSNGMGYQIIWAGFLMGVVCIVSQVIAINNRLHWQTIVFTVLCFSQLGNAVAVRSEIHSVFSLGIFSNKMMFFSVALTVIFQLLIIYLPFLNVIFRTQALTLNELTLALLFSMVIFTAIELEKLIRRTIK
jgi:Ca2+-transporting ATPase